MGKRSSSRGAWADDAAVAARTRATAARAECQESLRSGIEAFPRVWVSRRDCWQSYSSRTQTLQSERTDFNSGVPWPCANPPRIQRKVAPHEFGLLVEPSRRLAFQPRTSEWTPRQGAFLRQSRGGSCLRAR